ncbi:hypothetical protein CLU81_5028 [Flavobacterium sp. 9]|uniref:hypothetical protein n=1 Tax=Flavobacterium sp. 9 TaxID=2035198 RepID=UPI000C17C83E|nr:hypothetical protein [Flavobacterium sp. 9]PIF34388.1 hypothetical protein CLU81_5028 [Flavobacterium sp. 9]
MKKIKKRTLLNTSVILCVIVFLIPFFLKDDSDTLLTTISVSFTAMGATATLITLFIAIFLYERFGLESRFVNNQTDKVLELVDELKGKMFRGVTNNGTYLFGTNRDKLKFIKEFSEFKEDDKEKIVLISLEDYNDCWDKILEISRSYWLPKIIKEKISFLNLIMVNETENPLNDEYVRLKFGKEVAGEWLITLPKFTFLEFIDHLDSLSSSIEEWLKQHSDLTIDFKLEEPEKQSS